LPAEGEGTVSFIPDKKYHPDNDLPEDKNTKGCKGYRDKDGNVWVKGKLRQHGSSKTHTETFEWDVILNHNGWKVRFKDVAKNCRSGKYINVSSKGVITH